MSQAPRPGHTIFQGYYYFHHVGLDRNARDIHRDNPHFEHTREFIDGCVDLVAAVHVRDRFFEFYRSTPEQPFDPQSAPTLTAPRSQRRTAASRRLRRAR